MSKRFLVCFLTIIMILGCSGSEKKKSEAEKRLLELTDSTHGLIQKIEESELKYSDNKMSNGWKVAYDTKRSEVNEILVQLEEVTKGARFLEQIPDEKLNKKVKIFLHSIENIKVYITTTNVDLTQYFSGAPPTRDRYNWDRFIKPASEQLNKIMSELNN